MPGSQKGLLALAVLFAVFLIPLFGSSLRGLTYVLTCSEPARTPFSINIPASGPPEVISSAKIERNQSRVLCGGLLVDMRAAATGSQSVAMIVSITNETDSTWRGTVSLSIRGTARIPVEIGQIPPHRTRSDSVTLRLRQGSHDLDGSLLIGP